MPTGDPIFDSMEKLATKPTDAAVIVPVQEPAAVGGKQEPPAPKPLEKLPEPEKVQFPGDKTIVPGAPIEVAAIDDKIKIETPAFDEAKALNVMFGDRFKTKQEIEDAFSALEKLKGAKPQTPFASDYVQQLNDYIAKGGTPEVFNRVRSVNLEKATPLEKVSLQMQWENGFSKEDADFLAERKYRVNDAEITDTDKREASLNLQRDAKIAGDYLGKEIATALIPEPERQVTERKSQWDSALPSVLDEIKEFTFKGTTGVEFKVPLSKETLAHLKDHFDFIIKQPSVDILPDAEGRAWAKEVLMKELLSKEYSNLLNTAITQTELRHVKEKNNPKELDERDPKKVTTKVTNDKEYAQFLAS